MEYEADKLLDHFPSNMERLRDLAGEEIAENLIAYAIMPLVPIVSAGVYNWLIARRVKRLEDFLYDLCVMLSKLEDRISRGKVLSEEFEFIFTRVLKSLMEEERSEKRDFFRNSLLNYLTSEEEIDRVEIYLNQLDGLSCLEMLLLSFLYRNCNENGHMDRRIVEKTRRFMESQQLSDEDLNLAYDELRIKGYFLTGMVNTEFKNDFAGLTGGMRLSEKALGFSNFVATVEIEEE
jgi:hypothetical protein